MAQSDVSDFFGGKAYSDWRRGREQEFKVQAAIVDRINGVIKACGSIVKAVGQLAGLRR